MAAVSGLNVEIAEAVAQAMKTERDKQPPVTPQPPPPSYDQWRQGPPPFRPRGGYGRGQYRGQNRGYLDTGCFICGHGDHWYRECLQGGQRGPAAPYRGQGLQHGGPPRRGRGRGMPPQPHQMPYSTWEQGFEYDQWSYPVSTTGHVMPPEFDPIVTCNINGEPIPFMVDTGATVSCINTDKYPLSNKILTVIGFSGKKQSQSYTLPLTVQMKNQETQHQFLHSPSCPVNLLARDLLSKFGITIYCTKDGLRLHIPGEETPDPHCHRILYMAPSYALDIPATSTSHHTGHRSGIWS